jgi:hypothetical protein
MMFNVLALFLDPMMLNVLALFLFCILSSASTSHDNFFIHNQLSVQTHTS